MPLERLSEHSNHYGQNTPRVLELLRLQHGFWGKDADALQSIIAPIAVGYTFREFSQLMIQKSARLENATLVFEGRIYKPTKKTPAIETVSEKLKQTHKSVEALFEGIETLNSFGNSEGVSSHASLLNEYVLK
jgi:2C-methyl-D-erythritol 2,4-cyclodiphosphate synthase